MSWSSRRIFSIAAGALLVSSALVGCAGDATVSPNPGTPFVPAAGGVQQNQFTVTESRSAGAVPQPVSINIGGSTVQAFIPAGVAITAGQQVAVIRENNPVIQGLTVSDTSRAPGDIFIRRRPGTEEVPTGVHLRDDGSLSSAIIIPPGLWDVFVAGPLQISNGGNTLNINTGLVLSGEVTTTGIASIPSSISGAFPVNGGSTHPLRLNVTMPTAFAGGNATLRITHGNGVLEQVRQVPANGTFQFHDLVVGGNSSIPVQGVGEVRFSYRRAGQQ